MKYFKGTWWKFDETLCPIFQPWLNFFISQSTKEEEGSWPPCAKISLILQFDSIQQPTESLGDSRVIDYKKLLNTNQIVCE